MNRSVPLECRLPAGVSNPLQLHASPESLDSPRTPLPGAFRVLGWASVAGFVVSGHAWALPSPDVVVNLFASAAQVLGLLTVVLGRWFFGGRRRAVPGARSSASYRTAFLVSAGLCVLSLIGWGMSAAHQNDLRMRRLQANITRESTEDGKKIVDLSLKETGFKDQLKREDGFSTEWLEESVARKEPLHMLDIRETEEVEMGIIPGMHHVRFPDLMQDPDRYLDKDRTVYLFCANGNRSAEMAPFLKERGYECRFLIGGYEKWVAEGRHLETPGGVARTELRALPGFPGKDVLLDTPDVMALMEERDVLFVDVRYPGDFEAYGHLPDAVNLTLRKLVTLDLEAALQSLPKKPVIVPCYDRRSSFFALIFGVRWTRMGGEFLGRYTVPHEFFKPKGVKAHVTEWNARHQEATWLSLASAPLAGALKSIDSRVANLAISILLLVALIRLVVLPLTLKSDRDRIASVALEPRLKALKKQLRGDPSALSRATTKLLREKKVRPVLNLVATVAQLLLFTGFFSVVNEACKDSTQGFLWLPALGQPDPTRALPVLVTVLLIAQLLITSKRFTWIRLAVMGVAGAALFALVFDLRSGTNLYLAANVALLVLQTALVQGFLARDSAGSRAARRAAKVADIERQDVVPLPFAQSVPGCGGKASRLAGLIEAGLPVPDGFVVRGRAVEAWERTGAWSASVRAAILRDHARLGAGSVAVRSSALNEDGAERSYAGVFESILEVRPGELFDALAKVAVSLSSARARIYGNQKSEGGSILVQTMVPAEYAGVLFTEHPGESGACAVELVAGLGAELVSGRVDPQAFRFGRASGRPLDQRTPPIDLGELLRLGRRVEELFGRPQDIEWAYSRGRFQLLQSRDITRRCSQGESGPAIRERERARLLALEREAGPDEVVLAQNELSELLPEPTPFSLSWMEELWAYGGCTDLACRSLGVPYDVLPDSQPFVVGAFGSLYVNRREEKRRLRKGPGALAAFGLSRAAGEIERSWREDYLPGFLREMRLREAIDLSRLDFEEVLDLFRRTSSAFVTEDFVRAEIVNVAADFYVKVAVRVLEKAGLDPADQLSHMPRTVVCESIDLLARVGRGEAELSEFLELYGHRAPQDYELSQPRFRETTSLVTSMALRSAGNEGNRSSKPPPTLHKRLLRLAVERARRYQVLKEEAKHHAMREVAFIRTLLIEIGRRMGVGEGVFQLTSSELRRLSQPGFTIADAVRAILERQEENEALRDVRLPRDLTRAILESMDVEGGPMAFIPRGSAGLRGTRVSGRGDVSGRVRLLRNPAEIDSFQKGEILVARFTDPTWTSVFPMAHGIVTEVGGWLSHAAIQAREYDLTGIVGAAGALEILENGELVCLRADGTIERFGDRRGEGRQPVSFPVVLRGEGEAIDARLSDLSRHGALVLVSGRQLPVGVHLDIELPDVRGHLRATVVRNGQPGSYGLHLDSEIDDGMTAGLGIRLTRTVQGAA